MLVIEEIKDKIIPIAKAYDIPKVALFGSFARGEATEESDIDLLIERGNSSKMKGFSYFSFELALEAALGKKIDILTYKQLETSWLEKYAKADEVVIYEA